MRRLAAALRCRSQKRRQAAALRKDDNSLRGSPRLTADQIFSAAGPPTRNPNISDVLWFGHDRLLRDRYWRAGVGAPYAIKPTVGVYGTFVKVLAGTNSHYGYLYAIGVSRTFGARR